MEPKVSVVVPVYKVEAYLEKCLNTLVRQSLGDLEIIAVNDGSPDASQEILERFEKAFPEKVRVFQKENGGLSDARNFGLDRVRGTYTAFLDSDDFADLDLYQRLYEKAEETGADAVASDILYFWPDGKEKVVASGFPALAEGEEMKRVFTRFYPAVWNKIYRTDLLRESGVRFRKGAFFEDVEFSHRLFPYFQRIASLPLCCVHYRQREDSITFRPDRRLFDYLTNFESVLSFFRERQLLPTWEKELEYAACRYLLATFLSRAAALPREDFDQALEGSLSFLNENFPHWRKNPYFRKNGARGLYLRFFTPALCRALAKRNRP